MKVVTIAARNYLPYARVLARSFKLTNPDDHFVALLVDLLPHDEIPAEEFEVVGPWVLALPDDDFARMTFMYDVTELATALKPWALSWVLTQGHGVAVYLDPDIAVYDSLLGVAEAAAEHGIAVTPHRLSPIPRDGLRPTEADIMCSGIQNLGFIAVTESARPWLAFWQERLLTDSVVDLPNQLFTDQRWTDWIPALFDHQVLTDPGLNVAYWNLDERGLERFPDGYRCQGQRLRFYHFSGYRPSKPWCLSKYISDAPRVVISEHPALIPLLEDYDERLRAEGLYDPDKDAYRYGAFSDGAAISRGMRRIYRTELLEARAPRRHTDTPEPPVPDYRGGFENLRAWFSAPSARMPRLTRLSYSIWASRPDLQEAFPEPQTSSSESYTRWMREYGVEEGYISTQWAAALEPLQAEEIPLVPELGCNVFGYFTSVLGVGATGRSVVEAVKQSGLPMTVHTSSRTQSPKAIEFDAPRTQLRYPVNIVAMNADALPFWLQDWGPEFTPGARTIGLWFWELENFPPSMHHAFKHVDEIWTGSEFNAAAYRKVSSLPVHVFPMPVIPARDHPYPGLPYLDHDRGYFLFVFDYLSEVERKNPIGLIEAYKRAFPHSGGPTLVIKSINAEKRRTEREMVRRAAEASPGVHLIEDYLPHEEMQSLTQHALGFVSLHRSEGLGLGMMEAMALGTPVIATRYSGNLDFMDDSNSLLIPTTMVPVDESGGYYHGLGHWADPDLDCAAAAMRRLAQDHGFASELGRRAQRDITQRRTPQRAAEFVRERITDNARASAHEGASPRPPSRLAPEFLRARELYGRVLDVPVLGGMAHQSVRLAKGVRRRARARLSGRL